MTDIEFIQGFPHLCNDCKYLEYNYDDYGDGDDYVRDDWYTCSCLDNSDNEYDLPYGEDACKFKIARCI